MPPKKKPAAPSSARPSRSAKTKSKETIRKVARGPTHQHSAPPSASPRPATVSPAPPAAAIDIEALTDLVCSMPQIQGFENRLQQIETSVEDSNLAVRATINDTFTQLMDRLDKLETRGGPVNTEFMNQSNSRSLDVLSRWPWVDKTTVESIANGEFDINNLPKLHHEEEPRNHHIKKVTEGVHVPTDGSRPELVTGRTKMQAAFKDMSTFLSAWLFYISIRVSYAPERGFGLSHWTERLVYYSQSGFQWSVILNYAVAYFQKHQNSAPDAWLNTDSELVANHFAIARRTEPSHSSGPRSPKKTSASATDIHQQVCQNWNRQSSNCTYKEKNGVECPRRHVCAICEKDGHRSYQCPLKSST